MGSGKWSATTRRNYMARFKISNTFYITNRGPVLAGEIIEGTISDGSTIEHFINGLLERITIKSCEFTDHGNGKAEVGLLIEPFNQKAQIDWNAMIGQTVSLS